MAYTETEIQEALDHLVETGQVVKEGDGYYIPEHLRKYGYTSPEMGAAIDGMLAAFELFDGDTLSMIVRRDGVEVQVNQNAS